MAHGAAFVAHYAIYMLILATVQFLLGKWPAGEKDSRVMEIHPILHSTAKQHLLSGNLECFTGNGYPNWYSNLRVGFYFLTASLPFLAT